MWTALFLLCVAVVFAVLWRGVLLGHQGLIGGDILNNIPPWNTGTPPHHSRNDLVSDPLTQFLPWLTSVRAQWFSGHLPLWNPDAFAGAPLLANDQSAAFSPFTLVTLPFAPAHGYSLAMLLKLVVAGVGMGAFLRQLRVGYGAAVVAGVAYAGSRNSAGKRSARNGSPESSSRPVFSTYARSATTSAARTFCSTRRIVTPSARSC